MNLWVTCAAAQGGIILGVAQGGRKKDDFLFSMSSCHGVSVYLVRVGILFPVSEQQAAKLRSLTHSEGDGDGGRLTSGLPTGKDVYF